MSAHQQGGSPPHHSLAFRVMRLCRPSFQADDAVLRLDPSDLLAGEDLFEDPSLSPQQLLLGPATGAAGGGTTDFTFRHCFLLQNPTDALPLSGLLILPQSFGAIYLGETFCSYISINNSSSFEARDVVIKAEIQTEKQQILLLYTSKSPVESIRSGGRYDFIVEHDAKELGPHTLVCTALYNDGDSERKYLPQIFKFIVANPLSVRTKVRSVKAELCVTNQTDSILGPFEVFLSHVNSTQEKAVMVNGIQNLVVSPVEAFSSTNFSLSMIAIRLGVQKISGITVYGTKEKKQYDTLTDIEIFVGEE